jgi:hypothetical protein
VALVVLLCASAPSTAQKLDLDGGGAFKGTERTVEKLSRKLRDSVKQLTPRANQLEGHPGLLMKSQNRVQELALALLDAGVSLGEAGSVHILAARRISARQNELDKLIDELWKNGGDDGQRRLEVFLKECPADSKAIPKGVDELDALLARAFGELARGGGRRSADTWPIVRLDEASAGAAALQEIVDELARETSSSRGGAEAVKSLAATLDASQRAGTPAPHVAAQRQLVVQGAGVVLRLPKWVTPKVAASLGTSFDGVVTRLGIADMRDAARADMCRLAILSDVLLRIDRARLTSRQMRTMRATGLALAEAIAPGDAACDDTLAALRRGLVLLEAHDGARWNENRRVVREVRPLWREVDLQGRRSRDELVEMMARLTPTMPALSDPGVLGGMSAVRMRLDDGRRLCIVSAWLTGDDQPGVTGPAIWSGAVPKPPDGKVREPATKRDDRVRRQAGTKLLSLGKKAHDEESHDEAMGEFRLLADGLAAWMPIRGEDELRAALASPDAPVGITWRDLTGGATAEITRAIDDARGVWLAAWAGVKEAPVKGAATPPPEPDVGRIDVLRQLVENGSDCAAVGELNAARAWPGFEVSADTPSVTMGPLKADLARAGGLVISSGYAELARSINEKKDQHKLVATLAALERAARSRSIVKAPMVDELAYPPPLFPTLGEDLTPAVWLQRERDSLAILCRCLEEYADATKAGDRAVTAAMLKRAIAEVDRLQQLSRDD